MAENDYVMFCPRCDRQFDSHVSDEATLRLVKRHVTRAHPEYDPEWANE